MLEAHKDSWGSWRVIDVLGKPVVDLPEDLHEDLLTWRWLSDIARRMKEKNDKPPT